MSRTRTPQPSPYRTVELTRDVRQDNWPVGYLVFQYQPSNDGDYRLFGDFEEAQDYADCQEDSQGKQTDDLDDWPIYPLYASHRVVNVREPRREV